MPTKDELLAFASDHGIDVMSSATKAEIADAISEAGYEPDRIGDNQVSEPEETTATPDEAVSSQAQFSTYEVATDLPDTNPPLGTHVYQTLGQPYEAVVTHFGKD
jgi:hypothetical protein